VKEIITQLVSKTLIKKGVSPEEIASVSFVVEHPADISKGDYSTNIALSFSKTLKQNPVDFAHTLVNEMQNNLPDTIERVEVAGPGFINFFLSEKFFSESLKEVITSGENFGKKKIEENDVWAVEYASPNPNKSMHLGHLRNVITGITFCNLIEWNGGKVIREMVDNNRGIAIAKLMWGYLVGGKKDGTRVEDILYWKSHKDEWLTPENSGKKADRLMDEMYVKGASECEQPDIDKKIRDMVVKWEEKDPVIWELWELVLSFAHEGQSATLARLGAHFDYVWHEHEHYEEGKRYVEEGLKKGIFKKLEDGAILTNLESYGLSDTIVQKNDGTALYITQDLALTDLKKKKHNAHHQVWVIGPEQSLALAQLFAVCEQLGIGKREEFLHISYGYVSIKGQGKMSSRAGNVVYVDDFFDEVKSKVEEIMKERIVGEEKELIAEKVAHGAVVYEILKAGRTKDIAFDIEKALSFEGDSGPYLQYAHTRATSLIRKGKEEGIEMGVIKSGSNNTLSKMLYRFPEIVEEAFVVNGPQLLVTYLTELASAFNGYYANTVILDKNNKEESSARLALVSAFAIVMKNGLGILGIPVPEKM